MWFNLGDGDLTAGEVTWAIEMVIAYEAAFGDGYQAAPVCASEWESVCKMIL